MQLKIYLFIFLTNSEIQNKYSKQKHKQTEQTGIVQVENIEEEFHANYNKCTSNLGQGMLCTSWNPGN